MIFSVSAANEAETINVGVRLGQMLRGGEIIQLVGDLGAGKTTFVKGIVKGHGSEDSVQSPTFTICNQYSGRLTIFHCDFYRLNDDALIQNELRDMLDENSVVIMEWAENLLESPEHETIIVRISLQENEGRLFEIEVPDSLGHITL